jgi:phi13 family phage major tail protein
MAIMGLKNLYIAPLTKDDNTGVTYGAPVKIANAVTAKLTPTIDTATLYGDDQPAEIIQMFSQVDIEFETLELSTANYNLMLGKTKNSAGVTIDSADDVAPYFALGWEAGKTGGGKRLMWCYKGKFDAIEEDFQTKQDKAEAITQSVKGTFIKRTYDGQWRKRVDSDDAGVAGSVITGWFTAVYNAA